MTAALYKKARKLRKAVSAVEPLLEACVAELAYLEELEASVSGLAEFQEDADLEALRQVQVSWSRCRCRWGRGAGAGKLGFREDADLETLRQVQVSWSRCR